MFTSKADRWKSRLPVAEGWPSKWLTAAPRPQPCEWGRGYPIAEPWRLRLLCRNLVPMPFRSGLVVSTPPPKFGDVSCPNKRTYFFPSELARRDLFPGLWKIHGSRRIRNTLERTTVKKEIQMVRKRKQMVQTMQKMVRSMAHATPMQPI